MSCSDHICPVHIVILQCLNLILQLYNIIFSQHSEKDFEMIFWKFGHVSDILESFLDYLNQIDSTGKIKFTIQVQDEDGIDF